jgi:hypothetical protein
MVDSSGRETSLDHGHPAGRMKALGYHLGLEHLNLGILAACVSTMALGQEDQDLNALCSLREGRIQGTCQSLTQR